ELAREDAGTVDMKKLITDLVAASLDGGRHKRKVAIGFKAVDPPQGLKGYSVSGHDLRLGQVVTNLIENARSFVPEGTGRIDITLARTAKFIIVTVDDNGPGI